jgi:hypothetical protein
VAKVELKARISADAREFYRTMAKVADIGKAAAVGAVGVMAGGAMVVGGAWVSAIAHLVSYGGAVQDLMDKTGLGAETIQKLGYAAGQTGAEMGAIAPAMKGLANVLQLAEQGSKTAQKSFADLGLNWKLLADASPDTQIESVLAAIGKIPNPTRRAALAVDLLGKSGQSLIPLAGQYEALGAQASKLGLILPPEQIAAADRLGDALDTLKAKIAAVAMGAVGPDIGRLGDAVEKITANPEVWSALAPAMKQVSAALADMVIGIGKFLENPETLASLTTFANNLASGFAFAADAAMRLLGPIKRLLDAYIALQAATAKAALGAVAPGADAAEAANAQAITSAQIEAARNANLAQRERILGIKAVGMQPDQSMGGFGFDPTNPGAAGFAAGAMLATAGGAGTVETRLDALIAASTRTNELLATRMPEAGK